MSKLNWWKAACAVFLRCAATAIALPAQTLTTLYSFTQSAGVDGASQLIQAADGNLYGTTNGGGAYGYGSVFKISPTGWLTTLYSFCSQSNCPDGEGPEAGLVQATDGNFYGTTAFGGANGFGGTIFKITASGTLTTLYSFCSQSNCADGLVPEGALVQGTDGNFYGTTATGGYVCQIDNGTCATVFKVTPSGTLTTIHNFCSLSQCADGEIPMGGLVQGSDGAFYGTTSNGGDLNCDPDYGCGIVFKITASGKLTVLHTFCPQVGSCTDGIIPVAGLIQASDGNFYGTTWQGGTNHAGTVFRITRKGTLTILYSLCAQSDCGDGSAPYAGLVQATDGNIYGTTSGGGANKSGTVFEITLGGTFTDVYSFCAQSGCTDGAYPYVGLMQDTNGSFYGTTAGGGDLSACLGAGCGTIFSLSAGLGPFVKTQPAGGRVGVAIKILGTNLTGATSVTFNGTPATFTVEASSVIKATVPAGATTGTVQVVTPSGTLSSNVPFRVAP
ncbi:MAG TPA: choice-of-anchor tandem repeat GloVer-containing protein [Terriglobia bacterium]|nr:choice-of-anchor tandem repeat GloVer-containing protein [Terriglobia bacterium]